MTEFKKKIIEPSLKTKVQLVKATKDDVGQRLDNFLLGYLKGIPRSYVYRIIRKGEVRVNQKRAKAVLRLELHDQIRIPPMYLDNKQTVILEEDKLAFLKDRILYEDEYLIILNKPSGMAVHGGSTIRLGVIEAMQHLYPQYKQLELVHRLDRATSGCLILAKKKRILRELHVLLRENKITKIYCALTQGVWQKSECEVSAALQKYKVASGKKRLVEVDENGKSALTYFKTLEVYNNITLVEAKLATGRTHQIRVHAMHQGHPIALDDRYGDTDFNTEMRKYGLKRLFLHAKLIEFTLPETNTTIKVEAPLDKELDLCLQKLRRQILKRGG